MPILFNVSIFELVPDAKDKNITARFVIEPSEIATPAEVDHGFAVVGHIWHRSINLWGLPNFPKSLFDNFDSISGCFGVLFTQKHP
jgi:hypothetical protein